MSQLQKTNKKMKSTLFLIPSFILLPLFELEAQVDPIFQEEMLPFQKEVIAKLCGKSEISDSVFLTQRASSEEREITAAYLSNALTAIGWKLENHHYKVTNGNPFLDLILKPMQGINVAAVLPATAPNDTYVVFGSHYDTERGSPGAIDNATGIALCLSVARQLKQLENRKFNFILVFFDQEEDNEVGSRAYAKMLKTTQKNVHSVHTIDMVGWDNDNNKGVELELPAPELERLYNSVAQQLNIPVYRTKVSSSDHKSFIDQGFKALGISEEYVKRDSTPYYHTPKDTYDTVNFEYLSATSYFIFNVFKTLLQ